MNDNPDKAIEEAFRRFPRMDLAVDPLSPLAKEIAQHRENLKWAMEEMEHIEKRMRGARVDYFDALESYAINASKAAKDFQALLKIEENAS